MNRDVTEHRTKDGKSPTSVWLLRNPLDFIAEDHLRLRTMCAEMDRLADASETDGEAISSLRDFVDRELPALLADEDKDLIPLVLQRAEPEDELPRLARRLEREHGRIAENLATVADGLALLRPGEPMPDRLRDGLRGLATVTRQHLILENAVLLPLARARLTVEDLAGLRQEMLRRRGLEDFFAS